MRITSFVQKISLITLSIFATLQIVAGIILMSQNSTTDHPSAQQTANTDIPFHNEFAELELSHAISLKP